MIKNTREVWIGEYEREREREREIEIEMEYSIIDDLSQCYDHLHLNNINIFFSPISGNIGSLAFDVVIVDEASQATEAEVSDLPGLSIQKHWIMHNLIYRDDNDRFFSSLFFSPLLTSPHLTSPHLFSLHSSPSFLWLSYLLFSHDRP